MTQTRAPKKARYDALPYWNFGKIRDEQFPLSISITRLNDWPCRLRLRRKGEVFLHLFD